MIEAIAIGVLGAVVVFQQFYFMRQIQVLVDKVMSGSFQSYVAATNPQIRVKIDSVPDENLDVLKDLS